MTFEHSLGRPASSYESPYILSEGEDIDEVAERLNDAGMPRGFVIQRTDGTQVTLVELAES